MEPRNIKSDSASTKSTFSSASHKLITCVFSTSTTLLILITLRTDLVTGLGTCKAGELRCHSGICVPKEKVCDGVRDCVLDGLDENDLICSPKYRQSLCGSRVKKGVFQCEYGGCVPLSRVCDGAINCLDGSDESEHVCGSNSCLPGQFRCKYGACIPDYRVCNGQLHCPDGSDETFDVCKKRTCKDDQFMCKYGGCIPERKICDGWKNCADGSDETPELCLITRAKMQQVWEKAELLDNNENLDTYRPVNPVLSLTRRPTQSTTRRPLLVQTTSSTTTAASIMQVPSQRQFPSLDKEISGIMNIVSKVERVTCALPNIPTNSEATITSCRSNPDASYCTSNTTTVPYGVEVDFQCTPGYVLNGPAIISCTQTGQWSSTVPTCEAIIDVRFGLGRIIKHDFRARCPPLTASRGVQLECIDPKNLEVKSCQEAQRSGVEARFTCAPYYRPSGDLPMHYEKCGEDGNWSPGVDSQFSCVPDCGLSEVSKTPYILNGRATKRGTWPWHVGIYIKMDEDEDGQEKLKYICGAALITENSVLTSAHCVTIGGNVRNASSLVLFLGKQRIDLPDNDPFVQRRLASHIFVEDSFNHLVLDSDIALIALATPAVLTYYVRPTCYPQTSNSFLEEYQLTHGNTGTVLGWGLTENGTLSETLKSTELPVVSAAECAESHKDFFASQTRSTTFCAGYLNGTAVCNGDSGGGMYFRATMRGSSRWYVQGLVSYGIPQEGTKKCSSEHYAVFTRVGRYGDWIVRTLSRENLI